MAKFEELNQDRVYVGWVEPFTKTTSAPVLNFVTVKTAIEFMKEDPKRAEQSDKAALEDFMIVNWATLHDGVGGKYIPYESSDYEHKLARPKPHEFDTGDPWAV
jgi:hypothetical protein